MKFKTFVSLFIKNVLVSIIAFQAAYYFTLLFSQATSLPGALWAVISGYIVLEDSTSELYLSALKRIVGTFVGALVCGIYLSFYPITFWGFVICIGVGVFLCFLLNLPKSVKLSSITISVIMIVSFIEKDAHPAINAALRFAESVIGTGVAVFVSLVMIRIGNSFSRGSNDADSK